jgi:hypothetical protein
MIPFGGGRLAAVSDLLLLVPVSGALFETSSMGIQNITSFFSLELCFVVQDEYKDSL